MLRIFTTLLFCAAAQAATTTANLSVTATVAVSATAFTATGTATLTGGIADTGTFSATVPLTALESGGTTVVVPYTMTLKQGSLGGNLTLPISLLEGATSGTGSATIASATGSYSGDTGSFPSLAGSGSIGAGGISLSFSGSGTITTGGPPTAPPPTISAVQDAGSYTSNIAPGSIFVVKGSNLSASGYAPLGFPLPTSSNGTSISFAPTTGNATQAYLIYTFLCDATALTSQVCTAAQSGVNQLAAVLPSTVTPGSYNVTVTYNTTTSLPFPVTVSAVKFGIITQDSTGNGLASAQIVPSYALDRLTTGSVAGYAYGIQPAHPGDSVVVYGTGMGAIPSTLGGDNIASPGYDFTQHGVTVQAIVGGTTIPAAYAGRTSGASGLDQVNFTLPSSVTTGCAVTLQVSVNGKLSSATTLSIAPSTSASACVYPGLTAAQLTTLDQGGTLTTGGFEITDLASTVSGANETFSSVSGAFSQQNGFELSSTSSSGSVTTTTIGSCTVYQVTSTASGTFAGGATTDLDAGKVTLTGPSGSNISNETITETNNAYSITLGETGITGVPNLPNGVIVAGTYTLTGAGGKDVGSFTTSIALGAPLTITGGLPTTVTESAGLTLNWTGGNPPDVVEILGESGTITGTGASQVTTATEFICMTTAGAGTFTVPSAVLTLLPKVTAAQIAADTATGTLGVLSTTAAVTFSPSLTAGTFTTPPTFSAFTETGVQAAYQ